MSDKKVNEYIYRYLLEQGLKKSADAFKTEAKIGENPLSKMINEEGAENEKTKTKAVITKGELNEKPEPKKRGRKPWIQDGPKGLAA